MTPLLGTVGKKWRRDRHWCSEIHCITIPYSNCSQSIQDIWFVSSFKHVSRKKAKWLTPLLWGGGIIGDAEIEARQGLVKQDRDRCSEIHYINIPYSNCSKSIKSSCSVSFSTHVSIINANPMTLILELVKGQRN